MGQGMIDLTEMQRSIRQDRLDAGDENAAIKFKYQQRYMNTAMPSSSQQRQPVQLVVGQQNATPMTTQKRPSGGMQPQQQQQQNRNSQQNSNYQQPDPKRQRYR